MFKTPILCDRRVFSFKGKWKSPNNDYEENIYYFIKHLNLFFFVMYFKKLHYNTAWYVFFLKFSSYFFAKCKYSYFIVYIRYFRLP